MKTFIAGLLMMIIPAVTMAQPKPMESQQMRDSLLLKSHNQKTAAFTLLGLGAAVGIGGLLLFDDNFSYGGLFADSGGNEDVAAAGAIMVVAGGLSMLGSIPLFLNASANKSKALSMRAGVRIERIPPGVFPQYHSPGYPAVALRFQLK